jgi:hypothetical protein
MIAGDKMKAAVRKLKNMTLESLITPRNSEADAENSISKPQI